MAKPLFNHVWVCENSVLLPDNKKLFQIARPEITDMCVELKEGWMSCKKTYIYLRTHTPYACVFIHDNRCLCIVALIISKNGLSHERSDIY